MLKRIKLDTPSFGMEACHQIFAMIYANGGAWHDVGVKRKRRGIVSPQISEHHALQCIGFICLIFLHREFSSVTCTLCIVHAKSDWWWCCWCVKGKPGHCFSPDFPEEPPHHTHSGEKSLPTIYSLIILSYTHILSYHPLKYSYTHIRFYETSVFAATPEQYFFFRVHTKLHDILGSNPKVNLLASSPLDQLLGGNQPNKLAKLGDAIASHLKISPTDPLTHWLTDRVGARRCYPI